MKAGTEVVILNNLPDMYEIGDLAVLTQKEEEFDHSWWGIMTSGKSIGRERFLGSPETHFAEAEIPSDETDWTGDAGFFLRTRNLFITLEKKTDNGLCLEFRIDEEIASITKNQTRVFEGIAQFVTDTIQGIEPQYHEKMVRAKPFIQGQTGDWLLIEFSALNIEHVRGVCYLLAGRYQFDFTDNTETEDTGN